MKYSYIGLSKPAGIINAILRDAVLRFRRENPGVTPPLEPYGVFASNVALASEFAANNDMRTFVEFSDVLKYSDIIFVFLPEKSINKVSLTLSKYNVKGKIFCHANPAFCSDALNYNSYNTYASMHVTSIGKDEGKKMSHGPILLEGTGRIFGEFSDVLNSMGISHQIITAEEKRVYLTGVNFLNDFPGIIENIGRKLIKIALADAPGCYEKIIKTARSNPSDIVSYNALELDNKDYLNRQCDLMDRLGIDSISGIFKAIAQIDLK